VALSDGQLRQFEVYRDELLDWNQRVNLTAITEPEAVDRLHFADSLACLMEPLPSGARVLDVGAGAGFPGLPMKVARPDLHMTLLEATGKKARFLEHIVSALGLAEVAVVNDRAETAPGREGFDAVVARGVGALAALLELTLPFCRLGGKVLVHKKGAHLSAELAAAAHALVILGGELQPSHSYTLEGEPRQIVVISKVRSTPAAYPRRPGMPAKHPL
jgi:16S rRNA (guanine527-N7)-methyltransferase